MVDQITFQTISIMIAAATVVIGVINSIISGRREEKQRQEQLIFQRFQGYGLDYARSYVELILAEFDNVEDFIKKYGSNPEFVSRWNHVFSVYNMAGISLKRGADPDLIFQLYQESGVVNLWEKFEPMTKRHRERAKNPLHREPFEYLYNEARKRNPEIKGYVLK